MTMEELLSIIDSNLKELGETVGFDPKQNANAIAIREVVATLSDDDEEAEEEEEEEEEEDPEGLE